MGNLLQGLEKNGTNYNLFASNINIENVYVMRGRAEEGKLNIPETHIFQFDFLNDDFDLQQEKSKLPTACKEF